MKANLRGWTGGNEALGKQAKGGNAGIKDAADHLDALGASVDKDVAAVGRNAEEIRVNPDVVGVLLFFFYPQRPRHHRGDALPVRDA